MDSNEEKIDLADVPVLMKRPLKMGDYWYIVDKTWFDKLTKFLDTNDAAYHPGQIDNAGKDIFLPKIFSLANVDNLCSTF